MIYPINHLPLRIPVGVQSENNVNEIGFDVKPWLESFPGLKTSVWVTRPGETAAYPAAAVKLIGSVLYWFPNEVDTALAGSGKVEVVGLTDDRRKLSGGTETVITVTTLTATQDPPNGFQVWYEHVMRAANKLGESMDVGTGGLMIVNVNEKAMDRTQAEVIAAVEAGKTCICVKDGRVYPYAGMLKHPQGETCPTFIAPAVNKGPGIEMHYIFLRADDSASQIGFPDVRAVNPHALTIAGKQTGTYNGSAPMTVTIPEVLVVHSIRNDAGAYVVDVPVRDIKQAVAAGQVVLLVEPVSGLVMYCDSNGPQLLFRQMYYSDTAGFMWHGVTINDDGTVTNRVKTDLTANPPAPADIGRTYYQRWSGGAWEPATIDDLKADLGLA